MKWLLIIQGIIAILFGLAAFAWPGKTLSLLVILVGLYFFITGIISILVGITTIKANKNWWLMVIEGLLGLIAGVITFTTPGITAFFLFILVMVWAFIIGLLRIAFAIQIRKTNSNWWLWAIGGASAIIIGLMLVFTPLEGLLVVAWVIGFYALFSGIAAIGYALTE